MRARGRGAGKSATMTQLASQWPLTTSSTASPANSIPNQTPLSRWMHTRADDVGSFQLARWRFPRQWWPTAWCTLARQRHPTKELTIHSRKSSMRSPPDRYFVKVGGTVRGARKEVADAHRAGRPAGAAAAGAVRPGLRRAVPNAHPTLRLRRVAGGMAAAP